MIKVVVKNFEYKTEKFVIIKEVVNNETWYMAINKKDIDEKGKLTRNYYGGHRTVESAISTTKSVIDYKEYLEQGIDEITALKMSVGII